MRHALNPKLVLALTTLCALGANSSAADAPSAVGWARSRGSCIQL